MFKVVSEVENYHKFVPWCKESNVVYRDRNRLEADLVNFEEKSPLMLDWSVAVLTHITDRGFRCQCYKTILRS
jgi:Polyketide cyclase / dehydrase and lipid transport